MKFGVMIPLTGPADGFGRVGEIARAAEVAGYDSIWIADHVIVPETIESRYPFNRTGVFPAEGTADMLEPIAAMSFLMGQTSRIRFGFNVLIVPYRHPIVTAKMLATMDYLSGGRLILGIGVGWMAEEFAILDAPSHADRGRATDEYIEVFKHLWTADRPSFAGQFVNFPPVHFHPQPVQKPHPPIFVGGHSRAALRRTGRIGDGWNAFRLAPEAIPEYRAQIAAAAEAAGRDPNAITVNASQVLNLQDAANTDPKRPALTGSADQIRADIARYTEAGVGQITLLVRADPTDAIIDTVHRFAKEIF